MDRSSVGLKDQHSVSYTFLICYKQQLNTVQSCYSLGLSQKYVYSLNYEQNQQNMTDEAVDQSEPVFWFVNFLTEGRTCSYKSLPEVDIQI